MISPAVAVPTAGPSPRRLLWGLATSAMAHAVLALLMLFDVAGLGGGFGLGVGPGFGIGTGGGAGLGEQKRRQIFSLQDLPEPVRPRDPNPDDALKQLLKPNQAQAIMVPQPTQPRTASTTSPVVHFAAPVKPIGAGTDLSTRFASAGAGIGGLGIGGGGGGAGWSLGSAFGQYVGGLRKVGVDVAIVVDSTGSMQTVIDDLKERLDDMVATLQRLVPTARIGAVAYRDRDDDKVATAPRQSESFVVRWSDLTFNPKKVQTFLKGIVAEGGGDWEEAVKDGVEAAMRQLKWRQDAKKVIIVVGSSPPHEKDIPALRKLIDDWHARGGIVSTIDVSLRLHEEHERMLSRSLYGEEPKVISPLPDFYQAVKDSFGDMAKAGGGEMITLGQESGIVKHVLAMTFGPQWQKDIARVSRGM